MRHIGRHRCQIDRFEFQINPAKPTVGEQVLNQCVHPAGRRPDALAVIFGEVIEPVRIILQQGVGKAL